MGLSDENRPVIAAARERAEEMIKVAHPQFRDELRAYAEKAWK